jgi:hypothetical protein
MEESNGLYSLTEGNLLLISALVLWDMIWKFLALWKCGRNNHKSWFIAIAILNTVGILPIIYLLKQKSNNQRPHLE